MMQLVRLDIHPTSRDFALTLCQLAWRYKVLRKYLNRNSIMCEQFGNSRLRDLYKKQ